MEEKQSGANIGGRGFTPRDTGGRGGRGNGRNGSGGRYGGRGGGRFGGFNPRNNNEKFKGQIETLPVLYYSTSSGAEVVHRFLKEFKIYVMANFIKDMDNIFKLTDPKYPEMEEPAEPATGEVKNIVVMEKWKLKLKDYETWKRKFEEEKVKLSGVMLGQLSPGSMDRLNQVAEGAAAIRDKDPLSLVKAILTTHLTAGKADGETNLYYAEMNFRNMKMYEDEKLPMYYRRFEASVASVKESATKLTKPERAPDDAQCVMHFIHTLNNSYNSYKLAYRRDQLKTKPTKTQEAYEMIILYGPDKMPGDRKYNETNEANYGRRGIFYTNRGGRGGRGGRDGGRGRGGRMGTCHICGDPGHWKRDCPKNPEQSKSEADISTAIKSIKYDEKQKN
jgi:hypothetical protein